MKKLFFLFICFLSLPLMGQDAIEKKDKLLQASGQLGIEYLLNFSDVETGLWINPHIYNQVVWAKTGKMLEVEQPIREVVGYEDAWAWVDRPTPGDPYRKVYEKYKKPIYKTVGTKKVMVEESKPTKEKSSISYCQKRFIEAMNALAAYTVLELGVDGAIAGKINKYYDWQNQLKSFGLSDNTVELSLQILMMMKSGYSGFDTIALEGLQKLLNGQINNSSGKGLWGYYSVNWEFDVWLDKQIAGLEAKITQLNIPTIKDGAKLQPEVEKKVIIKNELEGGIQTLRLCKADISREFYQGRKWYEGRKIELLNQDMPTYLMWPMTEFDPREKGLGCLISTQVALYTINEAQKLGYFSDEKMKILKTKSIIQLPKSKATIQLPAFPKLKPVLMDALSYFQRTQDKSGKWISLEEECKAVHPFPDMLKAKNTFSGHAGKRDIKKHEIKKGPVEDAATVSAMHSLALLAQLLGKDEIKSRNEKLIAAGLAEYNKIIEKMMADEKVTEWDPITLYPYDYLITVPDIQESFGNSLLANTEGEKKFLDFILKIQNESGNFNKEHNVKYNSPFQPHPFFPNTIQDFWAEKDYFNGYWEHGQISVPLISTALSLLTLKKIEAEKIKFDSKWTSAIETFTNLRLELFGIKSDILSKAAVEEKAPEEKPVKDEAIKKPDEAKEPPK
jgi:hypothetical protein